MPKRKKLADSEDQPSTDSDVEQLRVRHTEMLNDSFFRWIQDQHANHRSESWRNGMDEYLKYSKDLQAKFPVTVDERAPSTGAKGLQSANMFASASPPAPLPKLAPISLIPPITSPQGDTPGSPKPTFGFTPAKPGLSGPEASSSTPSLATPASAKPHASSAVGQATEATPGLSKDHILPKKSSEQAGTPPLITTAPTTAAGGIAAASWPAISLSPSLASRLGPSTSTASSLAPPTSIPSPPTKPGSSVFSSQADISQLSATPPAQLPTPGPGFGAFGFGAAPAFGAPSSGAAKPFAFGASQEPAGAAASSSMSFGTNKHVPSFGSPQPIAGTNKLPKVAPSVSAETNAAATTSSPKLLPQPTSGQAPFSFGSGTVGDASSSQPALVSGHNLFGSSQAPFGSGQAAFGSSQPASGSSQPASGSSQAAFGSSQPAFGAGQPAFGLGQFTFGLGQSALGSSQPAFGSSQPASSSSQAFGSGQPFLGSGFAFGSSQPAPAGFGASQVAASTPVPAPVFGQASSQPLLFGSSSMPATSPGVFKWGAPSGPPGSGAGALAASSAAAQGSAPLPTFSFSTAGQNGFGNAFGAPATQGNGSQGEEEEAPAPEEPVEYEMSKGVLLRQDITWRHNVNGKWGKAHKGKVLLCHPEGDTHPHLQLQTSSGQTVSTARIGTTLKPQAKAHRLIGMLAVSDRHVTKDGIETFSEQTVLMTLIDCASVEAAKELAEKAPASHNP